MGAVRALAELLAPSRCLACGARATRPWCVPCASEVAGLMIVDACDRCALTGADGDHACWSGAVPVVATSAGFRYTGPVARAVVAGKARGARRAWRPLGRLLGHLVAASMASVDVVTWVPGDPRRVRWRGYDHAALLAAGVADRLGRPCARLLRTTGSRRDQAGLGIRARRALPAGSMRATQRIGGGRVLLVDDVLTTGATVRVAAVALTAAGSRPVRVAVLARAGRHDLA